MSDENEKQPGRHGKLWMAIRLAEVRLRFVAVMVVTGLLVANWEAIQNRIDRWTRPAAMSVPGAAAIEYYCPMDPQVLRDEPGNCPICGMPLSKRAKGGKAALPEGVISRVSLSPARIALAGVRTVPVGYEKLAREVWAAGEILEAPHRIWRVPARVMGRLETVAVHIAGTPVKAGDEMAALYSPDLVNAQEEYLASLGAGDAADAREKLLRWGMAEQDLATLERSGKALLNVPIRAPHAGVLWEGEGGADHVAHVGHYVREGETVFTLLDLSRVWVAARVFEKDLGAVSLGQELEVRSRAHPDRPPKGRVSLIGPVVDPRTRTVEVRAEVPNEGGLLKPGMYVEVALHQEVHGLHPEGGPADAVLAVPESAVIDTGSRRMVYVEASPGVFDAVEVMLGPRAGDFHPVYMGLRAGDRVVAAGTFLVDAETRLNPAASAAYFGAGGTPASGKEEGAGQPSGHPGHGP